MEILLNSANDIYSVNLDVTSKVLVLTGVNNFPIDVNSIREIYDTTHAGYIGLPNKNSFSWFRVNGLPVFVYGVSSLPAGAANGDTLNLMLDIPVTQSQLSLQQKQASASAGTLGTLVSSETPTGTINGTNTIFTLAHTPIKGAITLVLTAPNQPAQFLQYGQDFTVSGSTVTVNVSPITSSSFYAVYYY